MEIFVATRREDVPTGLIRYASVDGSVPGATVTWDHHVTGHAINLDVIPALIDQRLDGVGTTLADTDALVSVLAVLFGGVSRLPRLAALRSACWSCDHLRPADDVSPEDAAAGEHLHHWVTRELLARGDNGFSALAWELHARLSNGQPLPQAVRPQVSTAGRWTVVAQVALVELRDGERVDPQHVYDRTGCVVVIVTEPHPAGGPRYTIGLAPDEDRDLRPLLDELARLEYAAGAPCLGPEPVPANENWGGRRTVFGSPWNYGSRLEPKRVAEEARRFVADAQMET
ncbi:MAG: hypothetical protein GY913_07085 [Proteobacteria bacterium]|nr:hypothetical protein [Pseudomonadota bacterium]MCP4916672.1 hypothetical protein [Pseudomonadota bacterium]